jgi:hypothetical protein
VRNGSRADADAVAAHAAHCPRARTILGSFALVNGVVLVGSLISANRHVIAYFTCGKFG